MFDRIIEKYLKLDCYYRIDDKPVFSIFQYSNLVEGLGGVPQTQDAFAWMKKRCVEKGLPGLHIQTIAQKGYGPEEKTIRNEQSEHYKTARALNFDSATNYQFCQEAEGDYDYVPWSAKAMSYWPDFEKAYNVFYPHVSIGWDNTHRHPSKNTAVPGSTPDAFEAHLWKAKQYMDARPNQTPLITLNSWNEWTEGSYLLPDMRWGYRYLQAVRNVFG
jgi:hypothetical protein